MVTNRSMIEIKNTKDKGRGIFASTLIREGELISKSPCIPISIFDMTPDSKLWKYVFNYTNKIKLLSLDYTSLMNHDENPNVGYQVISQTEIEFVALKDISEGEELTINYGYDVINDIAWNKATTNDGPIPGDDDNDIFDLYSSEIPHKRIGKYCTSVPLIDEYYRRSRGKGKCKYTTGLDVTLSYVERRGKSSRGPIALVEVPYSIQGLQGTICNSELIALFAKNQSKHKNKVLMICFTIMRHMRNLYQKSSYHFYPSDYEANLPSQEVADILNENLDLTGICMKIAYAVDFLNYLKRYPDRMDELSDMSKPFKLKKLKYKSDNHWNQASIIFKDTINKLKDDCIIIYPDEFY